MNPRLITSGWTEDAGKARCAALEKQENRSELHEDNDTITCNDESHCWSNLWPISSIDITGIFKKSDQI